MKRRKSNKYIQINISTCFVFVPHPLPELCSMWGWRNRDNKVQDESNKPTVFSLYIVEENLTGKEGKRVNRPSVSNDRNDSNNFWALRRNRSQLSPISAQNQWEKSDCSRLKACLAFPYLTSAVPSPEAKRISAEKIGFPLTNMKHKNAWKARPVWTSACGVAVTMSSSGRKQGKNQLTTLKTAFPAFHNKKKLILSHIPVIFSNYASLQFVVLISLFGATQN